MAGGFMKKKYCECGGRMRRLYARIWKDDKAAWIKSKWWECQICHQVERFMKDGEYE